MSVAVLTNSYREERFIEGCIDQFHPFDLYHIVLHSLSSWSGKHEQEDQTKALAENAGAVVYSRSWETEAEQFNFGLSKLQNFDWVIICDADERYRKKDIELLLGHLEFMSRYSNCQGVKTNNWSVYWKNTNYELTPKQIDYPLIAVRPDVKFVNARDPGSILIEYVYTKMYHFSYVRTDEEMWRKISNFSHHAEFDKENWFNNKWLRWSPEMEDLHPVVPSQFKQALYVPCSEEIKRFLPHDSIGYNPSYART